MRCPRTPIAWRTMKRPMPRPSHRAGSKRVKASNIRGIWSSVIPIPVSYTSMRIPWSACRQPTRTRPPGCVYLMALLINRGGSHTVAILLGSPVMNVCIALLIESSTRHASSLAGRFLNWKPVVFLGVLSYSLYLWQSPFFDHRSSAWIHAFPQNLMFAFLAALASYFLVERPFLRLRRRLRRGSGLPARVEGSAGREWVAFEEAVPAATRRDR